MPDKKLNEGQNASQVTSADTIAFVTAAGQFANVTGDEFAASPILAVRYDRINNPSTPDAYLVRPGWGWAGASSTANTTAMTANRLYTGPLGLTGTNSVTTTVDRLGFTIDVAGSTGAVIRLGIYAYNDDGTGTLVLDAGTVPATSTGNVEHPISQVLEPGVRYGWALVAQGGAATQPTVRNTNRARGGRGVPTLFGATTTRECFYMDGVSGALPATWVQSGSFDDNAAPVVAMRAV